MSRWSAYLCVRGICGIGNACGKPADHRVSGAGERDGGWTHGAASNVLGHAGARPSPPWNGVARAPQGYAQTYFRVNGVLPFVLIAERFAVEWRVHPPGHRGTPIAAQGHSCFRGQFRNGARRDCFDAQTLRRLQLRLRYCGLRHTCFRAKADGGDCKASATTNNAVGHGQLRWRSVHARGMRRQPTAHHRGATWPAPAPGIGRRGRRRRRPTCGAKFGWRWACHRLRWFQRLRAPCAWRPPGRFQSSGSIEAADQRSAFGPCGRRNPKQFEGGNSDPG
mmetsp:Transcript_40261/g.110765  ORF Transcript_40261/g.110765 Transcript_40261/m.110765 type:complete len:279 (-) Transcript_40261:316-1152(-)